MSDKHRGHTHQAAAPGAVKDPVCGMDVIAGRAGGGSARHEGTTYWFCSPSCREQFVARP